MTVGELIKELQKHPDSALMEMSTNGNILPVGVVVYWEKDRNGHQTVMVICPPLDSQCKKIYEEHSQPTATQDI